MSFSKATHAMVVTTATGLVLTLTPLASAILTYDSGDSSATFTHNEGLGGSGIGATSVGAGTLTPRTDPKTFSPTTTYPATPSYQFKQTQTVTATSTAGGSTVATGSVAVVNNATTAGVKVQAGTGVTQVNPKNSYNNASKLRIDIDTYFDVPEGGFGPGAAGAASFALGGTIGSAANSYAAFTVHLDFRDDNYFNTFSAVEGDDRLRSTIDITKYFVRPGTDVPGVTGEIPVTNGVISAAQGLVSSSELFQSGTEGQGFLFYGERLRVTGYIEFQARNGGVSTASAGFSSAGFTTLDDEEDPFSTTISFTREGGAGAAIDGVLALGAVPEPATAALSVLSLGAAGLGLLRRRKA